MHGHNSGSTVLIIIIIIFHNQGGQEVHQNYINGFSEKILFKDNWAILCLADFLQNTCS